RRSATQARCRAAASCRCSAPPFRSWRRRVFAGHLQRLTAGRSTMPAARRHRNWRTRWRRRLNICARSKRAGLRSMPRRAWFVSGSAADVDRFLTTAKFRALRMLWARVEEACKLAPAPPLVAAETAWRMMTKRDPYVNMLRATIAVVAAGLGGADAITVL